MGQKRPIPTCAPLDRQQARFNQAVKENMEVLFGLRGEKIAALPDDATLADTIAKINEIIERMQ